MHHSNRSTYINLCLFLIFIWGLSEIGFAQVEINVKVFRHEKQFLNHLYELSEKDQLLPDEASSKSFQILKPIRSVHSIRPRNSFQIRNSDIEQIFTLQFSSDSAAEQWRTEAATNPYFEFIEENHTYSLDQIQAVIPDDDSISEQWYHQYIRSFEAWESGRGNQDIVIGVIDTGIDWMHPEFLGQLWINPKEDLNNNGRFDPWPSDFEVDGVFGDLNGIDDDGNAFTDDIIGYDFTDRPRFPQFGDYLNEDPFPFDDNSHGTQVSGVIGARADNQEGGSGIAPGCKLMILRAFSSSGAGDDDDIAKAIVYAADNGVNVLNFSFGDIYQSSMMHEAIKYAYDKGVVMVASAGNGTGDDLHYPSGYDEVISVSGTSTDSDRSREFFWPLSSFGLTVDLCAPASGIFTPTIRDTLADGTINRYTRSQGTSLSAPMVSSAAALLLSKDANLTPRQIRGLLTSTTDDLGERGWDHFCGSGRLNVFKALEARGSSSVQIHSPANDTGSSLDSIAIIATVLDPDFQELYVEWQKGTSGDSDWHPIAGPLQRQAFRDTLAWWHLDSLQEGEYTLRIRLNKTDGSTAEDRIRFVKDSSKAEIEIKRVVECWDQGEKKILIVFRASDQGRQNLWFRKKDETAFSKLAMDRKTRNGEFLLGKDLLESGEYEALIVSENLSGIQSQSDTLSFTFSSATVSPTGYVLKDYLLPMGRYLPQTIDLDQDQLQEVIMSKYDNSLSAGPVVRYEFNGQSFVAVDSIAEKSILLPKDIADTDGNGLQELLCSVNDSVYIYEQLFEGQLPNIPIYSNENNEFFAAQFADTDGNGSKELLMKNFINYYIFSGSGESYQIQDSLLDLSPDYQGSVAPRIEVEDFDGDSFPEIAFGDFDGDFLIYEYDGQAYQLVYLDTTDLTQSGPYVTAGDFDGDSIQELFIAVRTQSLRNEDNEYDPSFWHLRIFEASGDNSYRVVWESHIYQTVTDRFNAISHANLDRDLAEELIISIYPQTYVLEYANGSYNYEWYQWGPLQTHHVSGDIDGNGINEIGLGRGDSTIFFEKDLEYNGPNPVWSLSGKVLAPDSISLTWDSVDNAEQYIVLRVEKLNTNPNLIIVDTISETSFIDTGLLQDSTYAYSIVTLNQSLRPESGSPGNVISLKAHKPAELIKVETLNAKQLRLIFDYPVKARLEDLTRIILDEKQYPVSINSSGGRSKELILTLAQDLNPGPHSISIDQSFLDADLGIYKKHLSSFSFIYSTQNQDCLHLTHWEIADDSTAILHFSAKLDGNTALLPQNFRIDPIGSINRISWEGTQNKAVRVSYSNVSIGALGYTVSISASNLCSTEGYCMCGEGSTAGFTSFASNLDQVYVYPNPVRDNDFIDGLRFANLPREAKIEIFTVSGRYIQSIKETDGDGGVLWDMRDQSGKKIKPGIYMYHIQSEETGEEKISTFSVVE